jgi:S1-C subfamily serine protease
MAAGVCLLALPALAGLAEGSAAQQSAAGDSLPYLNWGGAPFQDHPISFEEVFQSVVRVAQSVQYRTTIYLHDLVDGRPVRDPDSPTGYRLRRRGKTVELEFRSQVGAGLILERPQAGAWTVLTAAHLVAAPDTARAYLLDAAGQPTDVLERVSVKVSEKVFVRTWNGVHAEAAVGRVEDEEDLALLDVGLSPDVEGVRPFPDYAGAGKGLRWGTLVYLIGFPHAHLQVAGGLVNLGPRPEVFVVSAAVSPGYSGGPVLAVRKGSSRLELVGICTAMPSRSLRVLSPGIEVESGAPATGDVLARTTVRNMDLPEYGTAHVVGIDSVRRFLSEPRRAATGQGADAASHTGLWDRGLFPASGPR